MSDLALAFVWHQHQPYYPDDVAGENPMPWVRLHGVKDYYGMCLHLLEFPEMRCTINLVPSLVLQILGYTERGATDKPLEATKIPAADLTEADALYLLDHFFMANHERMIGPLPRYAELLHRRGMGKDSARTALKRFQERDLRDLQLLFNLAWIHPLAFDRDPTLRQIRDKGRFYTEEDKRIVLEKHLEIMKQILPLHRRLSESGQIELTTTPYFHPILPLLLDKKLAREAMPDVRLPRYTEGYPEDAAVHLQRAIDQHVRIFGSAPKGMWPAEGSVCHAMVPLLAQHGIRWIATDEQVLSESLQGFVSRDPHGHVRNPSFLYRPYKVAAEGSDLSIVFRDHTLSDRIGFHYQRSPGREAAEDFLGHLHGIRQAIDPRQPALVSIILDGENCWEHYPDGGVPFLRSLYELCTRTPGLRTVKVGEYLEANPPTDQLPRLFAGSWINHNFAIWIGHEEDNTAWDLLHRTREHLKLRSTQGHHAAEVLKKAWEEMYIAEGSDWFWWYGDDHSSAQDQLFDYLFRKHLQNIYLLLGDSVPADLSRPIKRNAKANLHSQPKQFLKVKIDGRETFFEWLPAGHFVCRNQRGTMAMVSQGPMRALWFGFDLNCLFLRIDFDRPALQTLLDYDLLRIGFVEPAGAELLIRHPGRPTQSWRFTSSRGAVLDATAKVQVGVQKIAETSIPFDALHVKVGDPVEFYVELIESNQSRDRAPLEGTIALQRPSADFERLMWDV
jgi:alpha-amylase/alpha-mannosidase (GH57 family)